jgi:short-subunit dehydrogenase
MPFADEDIVRARQIFDVNFWGQLETTQAFLPLLLAAQKQGQKATVVLVSSLAGTGPTPFSSVYGASKAAADYVFNTLREELKPWDINVVLLRTGAVRSNMVNNRIEGGDRHAQLPANSLYYVARESVESFMSGQAAESGIPAQEWAQMVVKNLEKTVPPKVVFGGGYAFMAWIMQYLPVPASTMQGMVNRITGLEAVEKAVKGLH